MRDRFNRDIRYLRVSVTDRCNLRCVYCMPPEGVSLLRHEDILGYEAIVSIVGRAVALGVDKVRLTGGEPLVRRDIVCLVRMLRDVPGLATLAMTTNGTLLAPLAGALRDSGLDSVNVSLDTTDSDEYRRVTRGGSLTDALAGIDAALKTRLPVKLNVVDLGGNVNAVAALAVRLGISHQVIRRYDLTAEKFDDSGYDRPPACALCDRIRLLADGRLKPCLHSELATPVDMDDIDGSLQACVRNKPERGCACATLTVGQIGG